ncbi:MAG: hypothetical protein QM820_04680 [Minicystis sp.]
MAPAPESAPKPPEPPSLASAALRIGYLHANGTSYVGGSGRLTAQIPIQGAKALQLAPGGGAWIYSPVATAASKPSLLGVEALVGLNACCLLGRWGANLSVLVGFQLAPEPLFIVGGEINLGIRLSRSTTLGLTGGLGINPPREPLLRANGAIAAIFEM